MWKEAAKKDGINPYNIGKNVNIEKNVQISWNDLTFANVIGDTANRHASPKIAAILARAAMLPHYEPVRPSVFMRTGKTYYESVFYFG